MLKVESQMRVLVRTSEYYSSAQQWITRKSYKSTEKGTYLYIAEKGEARLGCT